MTQAEQFLNSGIHFYHANFPLPDGSVTAKTPMSVDCQPIITNCKLDCINFKGRSVLDVGCWDGAYCFYAEQRGATRVVGCDNASLRMWDVGSNKAWNALYTVFKSKAEYVHGNVYSLPFDDRSFDIVLGMGLLYHLSDPLLAVQNLARCAKQTVVIEGWGTDDEAAILTLHAPGTPNPDDKTNVYRLSKGWITKAMHIYGFELSFWSRFQNQRVCGHFTRNSSLPSTGHPATVFPTYL